MAFGLERLLGENMPEIGYFGDYVRFVTLDKREAGAFLGADNVVGDRFSIEISYDDGECKAWLVNPFGVRMGVMDDDVADRVDLCNAKGWNTVALLALVAYTEKPEPGYYWGEVALISYDTSYEEVFSTFIDQIGKKLGSGVRVDLKLGAQSLQKLVDEKGSWLPSGRVPLSKKEEGTALVKTERSGTERLVDQASKGNKGCTVASWIFLLALVALVVFGLHSCGLF